MTFVLNADRTATIGRGWYINQLELIDEMVIGYMEVALQKADADDIEGALMTVSTCISEMKTQHDTLTMKIFGI